MRSAEGGKDNDRQEIEIVSAMISGENLDSGL